METPRRNKFPPGWQAPEVDTGVRTCPPAGLERVDPDTAYWIGLVCQTLTEAGPSGLAYCELLYRTKLPPSELDRVLGIALKRDYLRRLGAGVFVARDAMT